MGQTKAPQCDCRGPSRAEVERRAKAGGICVNHFVATAVAEKLAAMVPPCSSRSGTRGRTSRCSVD
jgi:hypothetical protein